MRHSAAALLCAPSRLLAQVAFEPTQRRKDNGVGRSGFGSCAQEPKGSGTLMRVWRLLAVATMIIGFLSGCGGGSDSSSKVRSTSVDPGTAASDQFAEVERVMGTLDDYTFRGDIRLPEVDSNPISGRPGVMTMRVTADGRCESVMEISGAGALSRRTIGGTTYQQLSDDFLEISEMDDSTKAALRGRWTAQPDNPDSTCDATKLSQSIDLASVEEVDTEVVRGTDARVYEASAKTDPSMLVRVWVASGSRPLLLRIASTAGGVELDLTLASFNDGFTIEAPPADLVIDR